MPSDVSCVCVAACRRVTYRTTVPAQRQHISASTYEGNINISLQRTGGDQISACMCEFVNIMDAVPSSFQRQHIPSRRTVCAISRGSRSSKSRFYLCNLAYVCDYYVIMCAGLVRAGSLAVLPCSSSGSLCFLRVFSACFQTPDELI